VLALLEPEPTDKLNYTVDRGLRLQLDARIGHRFQLSDGFMPFYFAPTIGAVGGWERRWQDQSRQQTRAGCAPGAACPVDRVNTTIHVGDRAWVQPVLGAALRWGPAELGYSLQLDPKHPAASTHALTFGIQF
jgi:hypothetical protein